MKPDRPPPIALDEVERAHLRDPTDVSHRIYRYEVPGDLTDLARRFWIPVWSVPPGQEAPQKVLQYPVALIVVTDDYARFYGVSPGLSVTTLAGNGWGVGVSFQPAAGLLLAGGPMSAWTGRHAELSEVFGDAGVELADRVRAAMGADPHDPDAHDVAMAVVNELMRRHLPVDHEGLLVNSIVRFVEQDPDITRVAQVCGAFDLAERSLQRLTRRRLGLSPKWLIQRRRLHEAAERFRDGYADLADIAANLGYADQSHLTRDFRSVTGMTPGEFAARFG
ncbi:MAG: helix-turn-helix transcriptional regulator [Acidimicrobiia bacterium]|nr:helix-turn-helix transcriptional regulator [Acidimicrobiia bacterium]